MRKYTKFNRPDYCGQIMITCELCGHATATHDCRGNPIENNYIDHERDIQRIYELARIGRHFNSEGEGDKLDAILQAIAEIAERHTEGHHVQR